MILPYLWQGLGSILQSVLYTEFPIENKLSLKHFIAKSLSKLRVNNFVFKNMRS